MEQEEFRIATLGQVDSGKSTILGILSNPKNKDKIEILDNGRGSARKNIFKHKHEKVSGRTSSITCSYTQINNRNFTFIDLAGHEKYLSTTMKGISSGVLDYVFAIISCNKNNIPKITKEHLGLALIYKVPIIIIITKIDMPNIKTKLSNIEKKICKIMESKAAGSKIIYKINNINDSITCATKISLGNINICPIFKISNTNGENLNLLHSFLGNVFKNKEYKKKNETLFFIDEIFQVPGIGVVVSGIQKKGNIKRNDKLFIGPIQKKFKNITVKSIHNNYRNFIDKLEEGKSGCLWIKNLDKQKLQKGFFHRGMVITSNPNLYLNFDAEISILQHSTSIRVGYQPVIHCNNISQSAKIIMIKDKDNQQKYILRSGDNAHISFKFLYHPEYIEKNSILVFREGKTKGVGKIIRVY